MHLQMRTARGCLSLAATDGGSSKSRLWALFLLCFQNAYLVHSRMQARHAPNAAPGRAARMQRRRAALSVRAAAAAEQSAAPAGAPGGLNVREEQLPGCGMRLHVTVPAEQCRAAYTKFMNDLRKGTTVDGFRKGKAPDAAIIAQVGGLSRVLNSVLGDMLEPAVAQVGGAGAAWAHALARKWGAFPGQPTEPTKGWMQAWPALLAGSWRFSCYGGLEGS